MTSEGIEIFSINAYLNASFSIILSFESFSIKTFSSFLQKLKAPSPIKVTCEGILTLFIGISRNAFLSIVWSFESFENSTWQRFVHLLNAFEQICLIKLGILIFSILQRQITSWSYSFLSIDDLY